jgi:aminoglycoside 6'-N-acetyltransferase I
MEIKILRREDAAVLVAAGPDVFDDALDPRVTTEFLNDPRHHLVAAIDRGVVVGFASAVHYVHPDKSSPEMWINEVGVAATHRGRGVASAILQRLLDVARAIGCVEAWVLTDRTNEAALRLYKSSGGIEASGDQVMLTFHLQDSGASNGADDDPRRSR